MFRPCQTRPGTVNLMMQVLIGDVNSLHGATGCCHRVCEPFSVHRSTLIISGNVRIKTLNLEGALVLNAAPGEVTRVVFFWAFI